MSDPTTDQIEKVRRNLSNMQQFNDKVYVYGNPKIGNCYVLLTKKDDHDKGLSVVQDLLTGGFEAIASELGPVGAFGATILCNTVNGWGSNPPPDMAATFSNLTSRFMAASKDVDQQLAVYHEDPVKYWNTVFTYNGQTCKLSDLATIDFPAETDPEFEILLNPSIAGVDRSIWKQNLKDYCYNVKWQPDAQINSDITSWLQMFYGRNKSYWCSYYYHQDSGSCGDYSYWNVTEHNVSFGAGMYHDGAISNDACNYLFIDSTDGTIINSQGLYTRNAVFNELGLRTSTVYEPYGAPEKEVSKEYLEALSKGKPTISALSLEIGSEGIKERVRKAIEKDETLKVCLMKRPHQTLSAILGVKVPTVLKLTVVEEHSRSFVLVL